jgi:hypothetical protein
VTALTAISAMQDIPREFIAGTLTTTSVPDRPIDTEQLRALMIQYGLDASLVPAKRSEVFDFQQACRSVETRRGAKVPQGPRTQIAVGEVVTNAIESVYQVTVEVRDETNRVIEHPKALRVVYDKSLTGPGDDPIRFEPIEQAYADALHDLEHVIRLRFEGTRGRLPGAKVREILRTLFRRMAATRWAYSVWYVSIAHEAELEAMRTVIKTIYAADADFSTVPILNTKGVREIIEEKVTAHVQTDVTQLMAELAKHLKPDREVKEADFKRAQGSRKALVDQAEAMMAAYGEEIASVRDALALVDEQVMAMWERIA